MHDPLESRLSHLQLDINMPTTVPRLRIAIGQLQMRWSCNENVEAILRTISHAASARADICVFPELAVTGFHRQIRALAKPETIDPWLQAIQSACAAHSMAVAVGAPTFDDEARVFNSHVLIGESGEISGVISKRGLTPSEETFFARGASRPTLVLQDRRCTSVLCREVEDLQETCAQLAPGVAELIFWPGLIGRAPADSFDTESEAHIGQACALAVHAQAFVVQANWPNSLNYPEEGTHAGQSVVIDPAGAILLRLPRAEAGVAIFELGDTSYDWQVQEA
ncbi:MAG: carbon-nitrogen hydrolase family protein [Burkholderiales bacterium]|nr:carbon-nitrogen hydrolase family protein [Burkholderiales bacterium]